MTTVRVESATLTEWRLLDPVSFLVVAGSLLVRVLVERGFLTDFASIPRPIRGLLDVTGAATNAALLHDRLCEALNHGAPILTARQTDVAFRRELRKAGYGSATATAYWTGVRWGALLNRHRRAGWWRDAPAVLLCSLLLAPAVVPAAVLAVVGRGALRAADAVLDAVWS